MWSLNSRGGQRPDVHLSMAGHVTLKCSLGMQVDVGPRSKGLCSSEAVVVFVLRHGNLGVDHS